MTATKTTAAKSVAKKNAPKVEKAHESNGKAPTHGLTKPQVRILRFLAAHEVPFDRHQIAEGAKVADSWVVGFVGQACKANKTKSLTELGYVREVGAEVDGRKVRTWTATASGRKLAVKLGK